MRWVARLHHDHRVADFRLDVEALTDLEALQFHSAERSLYQFKHI